MSSPRSLPEDPGLAQVAEELARTRGASLIFDRETRLVWVSEELWRLLGCPSDEDLGMGKYLVEAYLSGVWSSTITLDSQVAAFANDFPKLAYVMPGGKDELARVLKETLPRWTKLAEFSPDPSLNLDAIVEQLVEGIEPVDPPSFYTGEFEFLQGDLPPATIVELVVRLTDRDGTFLGGAIMYDPALPATVLSLVARGDEEMYGRMARLIEPGRHKAALLFADLQASSVLSRRLPSAAYFKLVRAITTAMDEVVVRRRGIVGKHAGDGLTAFFLSEDLGSDSAAARAVIQAARETAHAAAIAAKDVGDETGLIESADCQVNVGLHWGGALYMGQLVTGGRLEVTALGDRVNEAARIQECARDGEVLASKSLLEHLSPEDAAALAIDPDGVIYRSVAELQAATDKARRDAGGIPVTVL